MGQNSGGQNKIQRIDTSKQANLFDDKIQEAVSFILENYNIRKPIQDTSKMSIECKAEGRYEFDPTLDDLFIDLQRAGFSISETMLKKIVRSNNHIPPYNPIVEYFDSIRKKYKGESQIDLFCKHLTPRTWNDHPEEYYRERMTKLIRKWLVACVACWIGGHHNDVALGFINPIGGLGKTHLVEFLVPLSLKEYYVKASKDDSKFDIEDVFTRYMFVNFDEMVGLNKRSIQTFKTVLSSDEISTKHRHEEYPTKKARIGCALFTGNDNEETGGFIEYAWRTDRRLGAIELEGIDREYSEVVDVDQLWSEALMLYEGSEYDYKFSKPDYRDFEDYNKRYALETSATKFIQLHLSKREDCPEGEEYEVLNATAIHQRLRHKIRREDQDKITIRTIGIALSTMNFEKRSYRDPNFEHPRTGYCVVFNE